MEPRDPVANPATMLLGAVDAGPELAPECYSGMVAMARGAKLIAEGGELTPGLPPERIVPLSRVSWDVIAAGGVAFRLL